MWLADIEAIEVGVATGRAASAVVEQRVAHALERLELEDRRDRRAQRREACAVRGVAERAALDEEIALSAEPHADGREPHACRVAGELIEPLEPDAVVAAANTDPRVRPAEQREPRDVARLHPACLEDRRGSGPRADRALRERVARPPEIRRGKGVQP
jgi:hypothetical protein